MRRELTARFEANLRGLATKLQARTSMAAQNAAVATMLGSMALQVCPSRMPAGLPFPSFPLPNWKGDHPASFHNQRVACLYLLW